MKKMLFSLSMLFTISISVFSQDITFIPRQINLSGNLGTEIIFYIDVTNITQVDQTVFLVRTINNLPADWTSSLCFDSCLPYWVDSATTTSEYGSTPLTPGETREIAVHVFSQVNYGTGYVQIQAGTLRNPSTRVTVDLTAIVNPVSVEDENTSVTDYYLEQNYPNPFNPSTKINFGLKKAGNIEITVYNILGNKVAALFSGFKSAGNHSILFDATNLGSGVYFYKIITNEFVQTKKMILEK